MQHWRGGAAAVVEAPLEIGQRTPVFALRLAEEKRGRRWRIANRAVVALGRLQPAEVGLLTQKLQRVNDGGTRRIQSVFRNELELPLPFRGVDVQMRGHRDSG